jgi:hypothetical protein
MPIAATIMAKANLKTGLNGRRLTAFAITREAL